ncbi:MAG: hypothetical protein COA44_08295 [Arcobacter sp.]|nr:MAG: hypothetical protein COA44_08295 [Arcobacter sp.]
MLPLIDYIKAALKDAESIDEALKFLPMSFIQDLPIAYIHSQTRLPDLKTREAFSKLLDKDGFTPTSPSQEEFAFMKDNFPSVLLSATYICVKKAPKKAFSYKTKNTHDYWKKIQEVQDFEAIFEISKIVNEKPCEAEFTLRENVRKRKEVHALKPLGFIYLADSCEDLSELYQHYFGKKFVCVNERYYIAWAKTLKEINMRYFLCPPKV